MKKVQIPKAQKRKLDQMVQDIELGRRHPASYGGKKLERFGDSVISIPLNHRWRVLFRKTVQGFKYYTCLTHESYNHMNFGHLKC